MIKSIFLIFSVFIATVAIAENNRSFDDALHAFYIGDDIKAKAGFILAAEQGSIEAEYYLGLIEKKTDFLAALSHFTIAARHNHAQSMWELGVLYENGDGVSQNQFIALDWFRQSALVSATEAPDSFYVANENGELHEVSVSQYIEHLTQQANSGVIDAKFALAKIYDAGLIVKADLPKAFNWYLSAAKDGHSKAAQLASYFYCRGITVPRNIEQANRWVKPSGYSTYCH